MDFCQKNKKMNNQGQNIIEFALVLPLLLIILFGVLDLGRIFFGSISLTNAAREGVRYLTLHPNDVVNEYSPYWGAKSAAIEDAGYAGISIGESQVTVDCSNADSDDFCDSGTAATVEVSHDFELVLGWILPSPITITRKAVMIVP